MAQHAPSSNDGLVNLPSNPIGHIVILAALVSAAIHIMLAPQVMGFNQTMGILFYLNGLGFVGGVLVYLTRYWRRELFLVAVAYALLTLVAFLILQDSINQNAVISKSAEAVVASGAAYLYGVTNQ
jgi:hypothetical protein